MIITENVICEGSLAVQGGISGTNRAGMTASASSVYPVELQLFRVWDAFQTSLGTAAADDLGITAGVFGVGAPYIVSRDLNALGASTGYARALFTLPVEYEATGSVALRIYAGMLTTVASVSATVDAEIWRSDKDGTIGGADLVTTSATACNSTTVAAKDFAMSYSGLAPGDQLDVRIAMILSSATGSSHFCIIPSVEFILTVKG